MPDPGLSGALIVVAAIALVVAGGLIWRADRRRGRHPRSTPLHGMVKDQSVSYFRDFGSSAPAAGVREEDRTGRWGEGGNKPS